MREVLNISLPPMLLKEVKKIVKKDRYASVSEFVRELIKLRLSEEYLFRDIAEAEADIKAGRVYEFKSIRDLMK